MERGRRFRGLRAWGARRAAREKPDSFARSLRHALPKNTVQLRGARQRYPLRTVFSSKNRPSGRTTSRTGLSVQVSCSAERMTWRARGGPQPELTPSRRRGWGEERASRTTQPGPTRPFREASSLILAEKQGTAIFPCPRSALASPGARVLCTLGPRGAVAAARPRENGWTPPPPAGALRNLLFPRRCCHRSVAIPACPAPGPGEAPGRARKKLGPPRAEPLPAPWCTGLPSCDPPGLPSSAA
jgi:hypothetical protein